jgi:hypothetical protein
VFHPGRDRPYRHPRRRVRVQRPIPGPEHRPALAPRPLLRPDHRTVPVPRPLEAQTGQAYTYDGNDPVNASDPTGRWSVSGAFNSSVGRALLNADAGLATPSPSAAPKPPATHSAQAVSSIPAPRSTPPERSAPTPPKPSSRWRRSRRNRTRRPKRRRLNNVVPRGCPA